MVGTVDYIAPEVFSKEGYTQTVDWWSLGTILFEMLLGYPPFYGDNPSATLKHVMQYKKYLKIPKEARVSPEAVDLMKRLIAAAEERLGRNGVEEIKAHPFFRGVDWDAIKGEPAPIVPRLSSPEDTCNFEKFEDPTPWQPELQEDGGPLKSVKNKDYYWIGYTYKKPQLFDNRKEIDEIFERLKQKKQSEGKRMFSEEKLESAYNDRGFHIGGAHNSSNIMNEAPNASKKKYNFTKKNTQNEYTDQAPPQVARFTLDINNKYCYSMTEGDYNSTSTKVTQPDKKTSGLSNFQTKFSDKGELKARESDPAKSSVQKYFKANASGQQKWTGLVAKPALEQGTSKKSLYQPLNDSAKPKSFLNANSKVNSSTNIIKHGVTKFLQLDPQLKTKMSKNFEKSGKLASVMTKIGSEMSLKKS